MQASERGKREQISEELWLSAMEWVRFHMHIVHWVADPYLAYMAADEDDLFHEAILAAVEALAAAEKKTRQSRLPGQGLFVWSCAASPCRFQTCYGSAARGFPAVFRSPGQ